MDGTSLSPSDVALLNRGGDGWGDSSFMWIFALLILFGFGGGWGGFGPNNAAAGFANAIGYENLATSNEVQRGFDNQNSMANQREILAAVNAGTAQSVAATNATFHDSLAAMQNLYNETARDIAALAVGQSDLRAAQDQCCCNTRMAIMDSTASINAGIAQNRYDAALNTAAINANTTAQVQKVLDTIQGNRIDELQNKVNQLELMNATANVVRYPSASTYYAGTNPFCGSGCGCGFAA